MEPELFQHTGKLIRIHGQYPGNIISSVSELHMGWKTRGSRPWHESHGYPSLGGSLVYAQFGNRDTLGDAWGVIPMAKFEYPSKYGMWFVRAGLGMAWFSSPYSSKENPGNLVLGSRFANISTLGAGYMFPLNHRLYVSIGASIFHCSNSHIRVPNIGANLISFSAGLSWLNEGSARLDRNFKPSSESMASGKWRPVLQVGIGLQEAQGTTDPRGGGLYHTMISGLYASRLSGSGNGRISLGMIVSYSTYYRIFILTQELFPAEEAIQKSMTGTLFIGREWIFGKFGLFLQAGYNVYAPFIKAFSNIKDLPGPGWLGQHTSNRFGYRYYPLGISKKRNMPFTGVAVKANGGTAEYLELSAGFIF